MLLRGMWLAMPALVAACGFEHGRLGATDGDATGSNRDASLDAMVDAPPGQICVGGSSGSQLRVCYPPGTEPTSAYNPSAGTLDTSSDNNCDRTMSQSFPYPSVCIKHGTSITIGSNMRYTGVRPIVLVSLSTITISGAVDVSSGGAGAMFLCSLDQIGATETSNGSAAGGGGGGGGGFGTAGGAGANGSVSGGNAGQPSSVGAIRGGCPGGLGGDSPDGNGGNPGAGGGVVYLIAKDSISVGGSIRANGGHGSGGGLKGGGGGGGSGGLVAFDAPMVTVTGTVMANGGGGGEGGDANQSGASGGDPQVGTYNQAAPGGSGMADQGGDGGDGSVLSTAGAGGNTAGNAGGGGGGGGGHVRRYGGSGLTGKISPPAP